MNTEKVLEVLELAYKAMMEMLPGIAHIPCDISLVNEAMMEVHALIVECKREER